MGCGRERAFGTLQDRMVKELRLAGVSSITAANAWLPGFIAAYNRRFGRIRRYRDRFPGIVLTITEMAQEEMEPALGADGLDHGICSAVASIKARIERLLAESRGAAE